MPIRTCTSVPVGVLPFAGGHEGAGVITAVGPNTPGFEVGDHIVFSFLPACGRCEFCARGLSQPVRPGCLAAYWGPRRRPDQLPMHTLDGEPVGQQCGISTFSEYTTASTASVVKIDTSCCGRLRCWPRGADWLRFGGALGGGRARRHRHRDGHRRHRGQRCRQCRRGDDSDRGRPGGWRWSGPQFGATASRPSTRPPTTPGRSPTGRAPTPRSSRSGSLRASTSRRRSPDPQGRDGRCPRWGTSPHGVPLALGEPTLFQKRLQGRLLARPTRAATSRTRCGCTRPAGSSSTSWTCTPAATSAA
jgi:hypothetical protein